MRTFDVVNVETGFATAVPAESATEALNNAGISEERTELQSDDGNSSIAFQRLSMVVMDSAPVDQFWWWLPYSSGPYVALAR